MKKLDIISTMNNREASEFVIGRCPVTIMMWSSLILSVHLSYSRGVALFSGRWSVVGGRWSMVDGRWSIVGVGVGGRGRWSVVSGR